MGSLEKLKEDVWKANLELNNRGLVVYTFGNVSGIDRESGIVVIKPSGGSYQDSTKEMMVTRDLNGKVIDSS
jgi:L-ribulose-5-phosphate 4-epimerase